MWAAVRKLTVLEYVAVLAALVGLVMIFQDDPIAQLAANQTPMGLALLQGAGLVGAFALGGRSVFRRDKMFDLWQWFLIMGGGIIPMLALGPLFVGAVSRGSPMLAAINWLVIALTAACFGFMDFSGHKNLRLPRGRQRLRFLAPFLGACLVAAAITALWPKPAPTIDPSQSPYRAWFPRESAP